MSKEIGIIVNSGMGGFLNPPGHPEHTRSVEYDKGKGGSSLTSAIESELMSDSTRQRCREIISEWEASKLPLEDDQVQAWIRQVLGYFKGCYRNPDVPDGQQWNASRVVIDKDRNPLNIPADHAGVNLIRKYYPDFTPSEAHFAEAKWGS